MTIINRYMFLVNASGKPLSGVKLEYDNAPITITNADGTTSTEPAPVPWYPPECTVEGTLEVWEAQDRATYNATTQTWSIAAIDPVVTLQAAKDMKVASLKASEASNLKTFQSSALGTPHTYLSGPDDMTLLNGEFTFVNSVLYDNSAIVWYTVEGGNVAHTKDQFNTVYIDGRSHIASTKYRRAIKEAQAGAATTETQLNTIGWPINLNPPSVPTGLAGVAGAAGSGQATLTWAANTDVTMIGGGGYNVYVDGVATKANTALVTAATFTATGLAVGAHTFTITAVDTDGNESAKCTAVSVTLT